jgi:mono/diheme cytochrome c family protein
MRQILLTAALVTISGVCAQAQTAGPFTQEQVVAGHKSFGEWCSGCHGDNLAGGGEAPALTGAIFNHDWSNQSVGAFNAFIANAMPQGLEGSLKPEEYAVITAFIMAANGAKPGTAPFKGKSDVKISAIADGKLVAGVVRGK